MDHSIPILLLKTRSQPHDVYEEYFSSPPSDNLANGLNSTFTPTFVPVLEHHPDTENLNKLEHLLRDGNLRSRYGGMIFTSQRAVEGWTDVVKKVEAEQMKSRRISRESETNNMEYGSDVRTSNTKTTSNPETSTIPYDDSTFPIYTVGPATSRALSTLVDDSPATSPFSALLPRILGAHTGNGAALAKYILPHYNLLHSHRLFIFYEAPRLPFIPLLGSPGGERIDVKDERLSKRPILFLVGETRRDIIPKTLMDSKQGEYRIEVEEMEVYATDVMASFQEDFEKAVRDCQTGQSKPVGSDSISSSRKTSVMVVVVFSPQGSREMLNALGLIDRENKPTQKAKSRWSSPIAEDALQVVIATIGPTTRDYLKDNFNFDADVCAAKPSPQGIGEGVRAFLREKGLAQ